MHLLKSAQRPLGVFEDKKIPKNVLIRFVQLYFKEIAIKQ